MATYKVHGCVPVDVDIDADDPHAAATLFFRVHGKWPVRVGIEDAQTSVVGGCKVCRKAILLSDVNYFYCHDDGNYYHGACFRQGKP